jgi:hypothetical protein
MARTSALDQEIRSRIDAFLGDISSLVRQSALEAVREALGGEGGVAAPARRGPGRPRGSGLHGAQGGNGRRKAGRRASGGGGRRSSEDMGAMTEQLLAHIRENPRQGAEQLGAALGYSAKEMRLPLQKMIADGAIRTEGQRRGTKYFAGGRGGGGKTRKAKAQRKTKGGRKGARKGARKGSRKKATRNGDGAAGEAAPF